MICWWGEEPRRNRSLAAWAIGGARRNPRHTTDYAGGRDSGGLVKKMNGVYLRSSSPLDAATGTPPWRFISR